MARTGQNDTSAGHFGRKCTKLRKNLGYLGGMRVALTLTVSGKKRDQAMLQTVPKDLDANKAIRTVVVIEDNSEMQALLRDFLSSQGYEVHSFWSAAQALNFFKHENLNRGTLVVVDMVLPGSSGLEFVQQLKSQYPAVPSIIISAFGTKRTPYEAARAGAAGYLTKPFRLSQLESLIEEIAAESIRLTSREE
jgi:CheY-like chemotaxis protein